MFKRINAVVVFGGAQLLEIKAVLADSLNSVRIAKKIFPPKSNIEVSALRWELYSAVQNLLDSAAIIVSDLELRKPRSYADLGSILYEAKLIDAVTHENIKIIAATRNILAHAYRKLTTTDLEKIVNEILPKVKEVAMKLENILEKENIDPELEEIELLGRKLRKVFEKHGVIIAYLFGSRAKGHSVSESDYDIAVLLEKQDTSIIDEIKLALDIAETLKIPVDKVDIVLLNKADPLLKYRVLKEGKIIYCRSEELRKKWERKTIIQYLDQQSLIAFKTER